MSRYIVLIMCTTSVIISVSVFYFLTGVFFDLIEALQVKT